jgi:hypothetical protein
VLLLLILAIIVPVGGYLYTSAESGTTVSITRLYNLNLQPGQTIIVNVTVSDVSQLVSCRINLAWNPDVLTITNGDPNGWMDPIKKIKYGVYEGPFLKEASDSTMFLINKVDNAAGTITAIFDAIGSPDMTASGSGVIAIMNFTCVNPGITAIEITGPRQGHSSLQGMFGEQILHQDVNGLVTSEAPPGIWTEFWFQATVGIAGVEIIILVLLFLTMIRWWRSWAEAEKEESAELDLF